MKKHLILLLLLLSGNLFAQDLITDRPDQTESSISIPFKSFQIETGFLYEISSDKRIQENTRTFPAVLLRYGLFNGFELRLQSQLVNTYMTGTEYKKKVLGFDNIEFGFKLDLTKEKGLLPEIAILSHVIFPSGSKNMRSDQFAVKTLMAFSHTITHSIGLGYNIGFEYDDTENFHGLYSIVTGFSLTEKLSLFTELYGVYDNFEKAFLNFDTGLTYLVNDNLQLDCSLGTGINSTYNFYNIGISWRIK